MSITFKNQSNTNAYFVCSSSDKTSISTEAGAVAFYVDLSYPINEVEVGQKVHFDSLRLANNVQFDTGTGMFTCEHPGTYVFSWTIMTQRGQDIATDLVRNDTVIGSMTTGQADDHWQSGSTTVAVNLQKGDTVWIRVNWVYYPSGIMATYSHWSGFLLR